MKGAVPPTGVAVAVPILAEQAVGVVVVVAASPLVDATVTVATPLQPDASVTVTEYTPAARPVAVGVVCGGVVLHEYVYGVCPPEGVAVAVPLLLEHCDGVEAITGGAPKPIVTVPTSVTVIGPEQELFTTIAV